MRQVRHALALRLVLTQQAVRVLVGAALPAVMGHVPATNHCPDGTPMKLGGVMIFVPGMAEAKRFYCGILGFRLQAESDTRLDFHCEGIDLTAFKCERSATVEDYSRVARSVFVFDVPAIDTTMRELRAMGVRFLHSCPAENEFDRYAAFVDPFGIVHEIREKKALP